MLFLHKQLYDAVKLFDLQIIAFSTVDAATYLIGLSSSALQYRAQVTTHQAQSFQEPQMCRETVRQREGMALLRILSKAATPTLACVWKELHNHMNCPCCIETSCCYGIASVMVISST